ncbi:MAG: LPS translocon maturation chaperone LptM [Legionellaceae bacterium]
MKHYQRFNVLRLVFLKANQAQEAGGRRAIAVRRISLRTLNRHILWMVCLILLSSCGQRGPLYLPTPNHETNNEPSLHQNARSWQ